MDITFGHDKQLGTTADRHAVSRLTYNMSIDIQYVNRQTHHVCLSTYCMSIDILYVDPVFTKVAQTLQDSQSGRV